MLTGLIGLIVGVFIGWNFPQPQYAQKIQDWIEGKLHNLFKNVK